MESAPECTHLGWVPGYGLDLDTLERLVLASYPDTVNAMVLDFDVDAFACEDVSRIAHDALWFVYDFVPGFFFFIIFGFSIFTVWAERASAPTGEDNQKR